MFINENVEKANVIYELVKNFAVTEILYNIPEKQFISEIEFIETTIKEFHENDFNGLNTYIINSDDLDISIQIFKSQKLWSIEYTDSNKNIHFSVEKFINF